MDGSELVSHSGPVSPGSLGCHSFFPRVGKNLPFRLLVWTAQVSVFYSPYLWLHFFFLLLLNFQTGSFSVFRYFNIEFSNLPPCLWLSLDLFWSCSPSISRWMLRSNIYMSSCLIAQAVEVLWILYWIKLWVYLISFWCKIAFVLVASTVCDCFSSLWSRNNLSAFHLKAQRTSV